MSTLTTIDIWHRRARPEPTAENFNVQLGCHLEEIAEMFAELLGTSHEAGTALFELEHRLHLLGRKLKGGHLSVTVPDENRAALLDALADQVVTAVGVGHCTNMDVPTACERVDNSNWSKFVDGQPQFNEQGKIAKGPDYAPPNLDGLY